MSPSLAFSLLAATAVGAAGHLVLGGDGRRLALYILAAWAGFALGQMVGRILGISVLVMGTLHTGAGLFGSLVGITTAALLLGRSQN